jgi:gliding motility-associated-like protein
MRAKSNFKLKALIALSVFFISISTAFAQVDTISTCSGTFTDPGGSGDYAPNTDTTWTFCPDGTDGNAIAFSFSLDAFGLGAGDTLFVYDGVDTSADILLELTGSGAEADFGVLPSPGNTTGCLTFVFVSDATEEGPGWSAEISCQLFCQPIIPTIVANPPVTPADTGWVDICQGETIEFSATAEYPLQGGYYYPQSDETSVFTWAFGDGSTETGTNVSHTFPFEGGFIVYLTVSNIIMEGNDTLLYCENTQLSIVKVRVSTTPNFSGTLALNDPLCITANTVLAGNATPVMADFGASGLTAGETFLPDGSGVSYQTDVVITAFAPGQILTNIDDLLGICLNMEHSYLGDLDISITCPDGTTVTLKSYPGGSGTFLGEPIDDDSNLDPGIGYDYCWSPTPEYQDMTTESANYTTLPPGSYASEESLDALVGCPLNGTWTITVQDNLGSDNGYIFYWGLSLNPNISPFYETFTPVIVDMTWQPDPTIIDVISPDSVEIIGQNGGFIDYTFTVVDDFGCGYDTTLSLNVLPNPLLFKGDTACANIDLEVGAEGSWEGGVWKLVYQENPDAIVLISDTLAIDPIVSSDVPGLVQLIFDDEYCRTQDTLDLNFEPLPTVEVIADNSVCWGDTLYLYSTVTGPVSTYQWNTGEFDPNVDNPTSYIVGDKSDNYGVVVSGYCGDAEDLQYIESRACYVETPNIITPNNDGVNDGFIVQWLEYFPGSTFIVYNRWGRKVFETDNYSNDDPWEAEGVKDGVYFFTLILNDEYKRYATQSQYVKGSVTITRERPR